MRKVSQAAADQVIEQIASLPIELVEADLVLTKQAAIFKATNKLSYADAFAAALAKIKNAELITGDPEFKELEKEIKVTWLK
jgi:predicted nucleic acid-binding protein